MADKYPRISISFLSGERAELNPLEISNYFHTFTNLKLGRKGRRGMEGGIWKKEETEGQSRRSGGKVTEGRSTINFNIFNSFVEAGLV